MSELSKEVLACLDDHSNDEDIIANQAYGEQKSVQLIEALHKSGIEAEVVSINVSSNNTTFIIQVFTNVTASQLNKLASALQLQLAVQSIELIPLTVEESAIAVIINNPNRTVFSLRHAMNSLSENEGEHPLLYFAGEDDLCNVQTGLLNESSPMFIAGTTGTGKSLFLHAMICTLLLRTKPEELKLILADTKKIEFSTYRAVPHLMAPVLTTVTEVMGGLKFLSKLVDERLRVLSGTGYKNVGSYNSAIDSKDLIDENGLHLKSMPYVVMIFDDITDLLIQYRQEFEELFLKTVLRAKVAGVYFVLSAQLPSAAVIPKSVVKSCLTRIAFSMTSKRDSMTILEDSGAEELLNNGELLYKDLKKKRFMKLQGPYVSDNEIQRVSKYAGSTGIPNYDDFFFWVGIGTLVIEYGHDEYKDPLYDEVRRRVTETNWASTAWLQRTYGIGYNRAARIMDLLESEGILESIKRTESANVSIQLQNDDSLSSSAEDATVIEDSSIAGTETSFNSDPLTSFEDEKDTAKEEKDIDYTLTLKLFNTDEIEMFSQNGNKTIEENDIDYSMTQKLFNTDEIEMLSQNETEIDQQKVRENSEKEKLTKKRKYYSLIYDWLIMLGFILSDVLVALFATNSIWDIHILVFSTFGIVLAAPFLRNKVLDIFNKDKLRKNLVIFSIIAVITGWIINLLL